MDTITHPGIRPGTRHGMFGGGFLGIPGGLARTGSVGAPSLIRPAADPIGRSTSSDGAPRRPKRRGVIFAAAALLAAAVGVGVAAPRIDSTVTGDASTLEQAVDPATLNPGSMYNVVDQIGARSLWAQGVTGAGVNVAVIDTGVADVAALGGDGKVVAMADLSSEFADPSTRFVDTYGHGTMMAGIIAGSEPGADPATGADHPEKFLGVAPDAGIVSVKISGRDGASDPVDVAAGIDWVVANADDLGIRVINLSYSSGSPLSYVDDPLTAAVERAWNAGITVVTIAGNDGTASTQLASPGVDPYAITVAGAEATDAGLAIAEFSNSGDGVRNPDVAAPGGHIESLRAPGSNGDVNHSDVGSVDGDPMLFTGTGTSQAAAVTSGVVALLLSQDPSMTPDQVKAALIETAEPITGSDTAAGADLIRADQAVSAPLSTTTQSFTPAVTRSPSDVSSVPACTSSDCWGGAHWGGAHWGGAHWGGAHWGGAHWGGAHWGGAHWGGAHWGGAHWGGAHWGGAHWGGAHWGGAHWGGAHWGGAHWGGAHWGGAHWGGAHWGGAHWGGAHWGGAHWGGAHWGGAHWGGAHWGGAHWGGAHWGGAHWGGAHWGGAHWGGAHWG